MVSLEQEKQQQGQFQAALDAAAEQFAAPTEPERPVLWVTRCESALDELMSRLHEELEVHQAEYAQIEENDLGLEPKLNEMRGEDGVIVEEGNQLVQRVAALRQRMSNGDTDEAAWEVELTQLSEQGLAWISRVRRQELAVRTWLVEAFTRDRGEGD